MANDTLVSEMLLALEANIEYLRQNGNSQITIRNGQFINDVGGVHLYEFALDFLQDIDLDAEVEIKVRNESANGKIIALEDKKVQLELDKNLGVVVPEAKLIISSYYLLQLLHDKLQEAKNGTIKFTNCCEKTFNITPAAIGIDKNYIIPSSVYQPPNQYQEEAIRLSLGSDVSFIWGPPGTGKSQTIASIIEGFITQNKSVLLLSHTNAATDGALSFFVKNAKEKSAEDYNSGKFLRIGNIYKPELSRNYSLVKTDAVAEKLRLPIKNEIDQIKREINTLALSTKNAEEVIKKFQQFRSLLSVENKLKEEINTNTHKVEQITNSLASSKEKLDTLNQNIIRCQSKGFLGRFFAGLNLEKLTKEKSELLIYIDKSIQTVSSCKANVTKSTAKIQKISIEKTEYENELKNKNIDDCQKIVDENAKKTKNLEEQISLLNKQMEELTVNLIKEAKVIATTLTKSYSSKIVLEREYDCVIVDEASMAPLPALWCATGLAKQRVVIVGDFYQLPPVVKHRVAKDKKTEEERHREEQLVNKWLAKDIFEIAGICSAIKNGQSPQWLKQLKIQYRMHPDIAEVINTFIYSKGSQEFSLESGSNTYDSGKEILAKEPLSNSHIGIYDTSTIGTIASRTDSGSYYNFYHAFLAAELAKQALESGYKSVGIITPFRPQANLIQKLLIDLGIDDKGASADTVHRFQGDEKQIIIFDSTTYQPTKLTDDQENGGDDEKLINVAFSRAKEKCILIADVPNILKKHSESSLFKKFINFCKEKKYPIISSETVISRYNVNHKTELWLEKIYNTEDLDKELHNSKLYSETDFYQNFIKDLLKAEKEVIIDSPYITTERVRILMPFFEHLVRKGVNIFILTRQPKEHSSSMKYQAEGVIEQMEKLGIIVLPFVGRIHRKLAIIDRKILWEGSLNILSQRDSREIMRRFEGKETAKQMVNFLRIDKNIGKLGENNLKRCNICKSWYWTDRSVFGLWTFCLVGMHKPNEKPKSEKERLKEKKELSKLKQMKKKTTADGVPICPIHKIPMNKKTGPFGDFWGCPKYPRCRITEKINT